MDDSNSGARSADRLGTLLTVGWLHDMAIEASAPPPQVESSQKPSDTIQNTSSHERLEEMQQEHSLSLPSMRTIPPRIEDEDHLPSFSAFRGPWLLGGVGGAPLTPSSNPNTRITNEAETSPASSTFRDFANDPPSMYDPNPPQRGGVLRPFPMRLHEMLDEIERLHEQGDDTYYNVVSWRPHGRCFLVKRPQAFKTIVLPKFFPNASQIASFQRQLNLYGFIRMCVCGPDKGAYYHPRFLRNRHYLVPGMIRTKVKGTKVRRKSDASCEPDFSRMSPVT